MLFALPGYQFPYTVMNRCLYLRSCAHIDLQFHLEELPPWRFRHNDTIRRQFIYADVASKVSDVAREISANGNRWLSFCAVYSGAVTVASFIIPNVCTHRSDRPTALAISSRKRLGKNCRYRRFACFARKQPVQYPMSKWSICHLCRST
jgi:hypothetical protein